MKEYMSQAIYPFKNIFGCFLENNPQISVVVPVKNEEDNIESLIKEINDALKNVSIEHEIIYIDDGSTDKTLEILKKMREKFSQLRIIYHQTSCGQSASIRTAILAAKSNIIVTLDGDGQNVPADIPKLVTPLLAQNAAKNLGMVAGQREKRVDSMTKKISSKIANYIRQALLKDGIRDTGCGLKAFRRDMFLLLPYFDHIHRYLPALAIREGYNVITQDVQHRSRENGISKYGTIDRLIAALSDLIGVIWLIRRRKKTSHIEEV
jgi:dolichol-phosphate mannosyltransferase